MGSQPLVYVVTLSWNRYEDTHACLDSMRKLKYENKRLLLVDNGSEDQTLAKIPERFPEVELIKNDRNMGFSAGFNVGLRHALKQGAEFVLILNNDTVIDPLALSYMLPLAGEDVGMIAPKIFYAAEPDTIWSVGAKRHPLTLEMTGDARGEVNSERWDTVQERDYFVGCALLLSRRLLTEVGLLDERFFMYYEDSDWSIRARQAGLKLLLSPRSKVWHKIAVSSGGSDSPNERYWMARSSIVFFSKHVTGFRWFIVVPYRLASALKTTLRLIGSGRSGSAAAYWRGLRDGIREALKHRN